MSETNKYGELVKHLGTEVKGHVLLAVEEILNVTTAVLIEAHALACEENNAPLADAALKGLEFTCKGLEKVQAL